MELATRTLDFARALGELSIRGNAIIDGGTALVQWLAREKIDRQEFEYCMGILRDKATPNDRGLHIQRSIQKAESLSSARKLASLSLGASGSVGRMIASSPEYAYLVTTLAAVMADHDVTFAGKVICNMVLDPGGHQHGIIAPYDVRKIRIKPVVEKVVGSIALTIVNSGHALEDLPAELKEYCAHVSGWEVFAATIATVQKHSSPAIVINTDVLYADILLWLLSHWHGTLQVVVKGKIVYVHTLGENSDDRKITILVDTVCDPESNEHKYGLNAKIEISLDQRNTNKSEYVFRTGGDADEVRATPAPTTRFPLYELTRIAKPAAVGSLNRSTLTQTELNQVHVTAQAVADWLLHLPLKPLLSQDLGAGSQYSGFLIGDHDTSSLTVAKILSHWPSFNRGRYGELPKNVVVYRGGAVDPVYAGYHAQAGVKASILEETGCIVECFPPIQTLLDLVRPRCGCHGCKDDIDPAEVKPGCLRETAMNAFFTLLGHVVADGFGIEDASGIGNPYALKLIVTKLLHEVAIYEHILWDTWLAVALTVYFGYDWSKINFSANEGASSIVAAQHGTLIAAAKWLDIAVDNPVDGCFGVEIGDGQLSGLPDDFAIVQSERNQSAPSRIVETLPDSGKILSYFLERVQRAHIS